MDIPEAIAQLEQLPTPDAIADELVSRGITAHQAEPHACAIAIYLQETTGEQVGVGLSGIWNNRTNTNFYTGIIAYRARFGHDQRCPAPRVAQFVHAFDEGKYPKLLKED